MTDASYLQGIRTSYDTVTESYAELIGADEPWETSMLTVLATTTGLTRHAQLTTNLTGKSPGGYLFFQKPLAPE